MHFATKARNTRVMIWIIWLLVLVFSWGVASNVTEEVGSVSLAGVVLHEEDQRALFPWQPRWRWRKWAWRHYQASRQAYRKARRVASLAKLALRGLLPMAQVVDWLTDSQLRHKMGALPVLYALLETLEVRKIINKHCPTQAEVDHGAVALVLVLNRLMMPLPLYRVADWIAQTVLVAVLDVPAAKFNDDRLGRTLDAMAPHLEVIWLEVTALALRKADVDLSVIFYDLSAFIAHGRYALSDLIDFGFAHNTPSNKRKFKLGLNVSADGGIPWLYRPWSGRTADQATVQENLRHLQRCLRRYGSRRGQPLLVGDRAMLNAEIAFTYHDLGLRYLGGLRCVQKEHKALLQVWSDEQFQEHPIVAEDEPQYWGRGCQVTFSLNGRTIKHRGLVVLAGPLRDQLREARSKQLRAAEAALSEVRADIGHPRLRTVKAVRRRVDARLRTHKVAPLLDVEVYETPEGGLTLTWQINETRLAEAERGDGRYLLVSNDWSLSHQELFQLYRDKDAVEKRFAVSKKDLRVSPIYIHQEQRIASMLLLNMLALLAYSILERQMRQQGLALTTRQLIRRLENLTLIETRCHDGSRLYRLSPLSPECQVILQLVAVALEQMLQTTIANENTLLLLPRPALCLARRC